MPKTASRRRSLALILVAAALHLTVPAARAQDGVVGPVRAQDSPAVMKAKRDLVFREARAEARERREAAAKLRRLPRKLALAKLAGVRVRPAVPDAAEGPAAGPPARLASPFAGAAISTIPTNVLVNNKAGDASTDTQSEEGLAMLGDRGLCAWNDGHNFNTMTVDAQQAAYTTNGGVSWVDVGPPPKPAGGRWASDPVVTMNQKTGEFYYCGLIDFPLASTNGIVVVPATFPGGTFTWGTPHIVRNGPDSGIFFDKEWMVADSSSGDLYLTYTTFDGAFTTDSILFQRSTNDGVSWGNPILMNTDLQSFGNVQGSRPAAGPTGQVYVTWYEYGTTFDYMKVRKSTNLGASFASEVVADPMYSNFGTGAPGFNRDHGLNFPSIAVDRSSGPHRGRVYLAWNESVNWYDDPLGGAGPKSEVEPDDATSSAVLFTPGQRLRGSLSTSTDLDYFKFSATQGTSYIFWCDSLRSTIAYTMRVFCTDGSTRLAYSGATSCGALGADAFILWTAPSSGTYYLRMAGVSPTQGGVACASFPGGYRVETGVDTPSAEDRARDQRDAMVAWSDDGVSWSAQTRMDDDAALYDNFLSEVAVSCEGRPYGMWYDFRSAPAANCGGVADIYTTRSTDGGATWAANQRLTSSSTNFTTAGSNLAPNMGDYSGMSGGESVAYAWADGRLGDVDVWATRLLAAPALTCPGGQTVNSGTTFTLDFPVQNLNLLFGNTYTLALQSERVWPISPASQNLTLASSATGTASFSVTVPDTTPSLVNNLTLRLSAQNGGQCGICVVPIRVVGATGVEGNGGELALAGAWPNPASAASGFTIAFSLAGQEPATLELLDLSGRRVLSREVGSLGAGSHVISWQREAAALSAGVYIVRLSTRGRALSSKIVVMR